MNKNSSVSGLTFIDLIGLIPVMNKFQKVGLHPLRQERQARGLQIARASVTRL